MWLHGTQKFFGIISANLSFSLFFALCLVLMCTQYYNEYLERRDFYLGLQLERQRVKIEEEKEKADQLLLNILPKSIINSLKV